LVEEGIAETVTMNIMRMVCRCYNKILTFRLMGHLFDRLQNRKFAIGSAFDIVSGGQRRPHSQSHSHRSVHSVTLPTDECVGGRRFPEAVYLLVNRHRNPYLAGLAAVIHHVFDEHVCVMRMRVDDCLGLSECETFIRNCRALT